MTDEQKTKEESDIFSNSEMDLVLPGEGDISASNLLEDEEAGLETDDHQAAEIREIFGTAFPQYLQPVEEVVEQILAGEGDPESIEALTGMVSSLIDASHRMGFASMGELLSQLQEHIFAIDLQNDSAIPTDIREGILGVIMDIKDLATEMGGGEPAPAAEPSQTIVAALKNKEGVGKLALKRLSAAGLVTVDQLLMGRPDEIAAVSGLDIQLVNKILSYVRPEEAAPPQSARDKVPHNARENVPHNARENVPHNARENAVVESEKSSPELGALHEKVLQLLHLESEYEATVEELNAEIRSLQSRIYEYRAELKSVAISTQEHAKAWEHFTSELSKKTKEIEELKARRDALLRRYRSSEETVQKKELLLLSHKEKRRRIESDAINLSRQLNSLVEKVSRVRRAVARRQLV